MIRFEFGVQVRLASLLGSGTYGATGMSCLLLRIGSDMVLV